MHSRQGGEESLAVGKKNPNQLGQRLCFLLVLLIGVALTLFVLLSSVVLVVGLWKDVCFFSLPSNWEHE